MDILDDMGVSKLSAKVFFKVNYSFKWTVVLSRVFISAILQRLWKKSIQSDFRGFIILDHKNVNGYQGLLKWVKKTF